MRESYLLAIDQGTTGTTALIVDADGVIRAKKTQEFPQHFPQPGWVEHNLHEIWTSVLSTIDQVLKAAEISGQHIAAIGITNQRETTCVWNRRTLEPLANAIVWQCKRSSQICLDMKEHEPLLRTKTGLVLDPYFSATKLKWLLDENPGWRERGQKGELCFGTMDSFLAAMLTAGEVHVTDVTNASRTLLFSIKELKWDHDLVHMFSIPMEVLAKTLPSASEFGTLIPEILGVKIPINAICGDQQASHYGAGDSLWTTKATFGTGIFVSQTIGEEFKTYPGFFTTLLPHAKQPWYGIEVAIPNAGARMQLVLENPERKLALVHEFAESVAKSVAKLPHEPHTLIIDGGITQAKELAPTLARLTGLHIKTQKITDGTALGVAKLLLGGENFPRTL
jgi:glycerol kinase